MEEEKSKRFSSKVLFTYIPLVLIVLVVLLSVTMARTSTNQFWPLLS